MPKVYLTSKAKQAERERRQNDVIALLVRTNKGRNGVADMELAQMVAVNRTAIYRYKTPDGIGGASFEKVRQVFHAVGGTKEEWLKAGGFE